MGNFVFQPHSSDASKVWCLINHTSDIKLNKRRETWSIGVRAHATRLWPASKIQVCSQLAPMALTLLGKSSRLPAHFVQWSSIFLSNTPQREKNDVWCFAKYKNFFDCILFKSIVCIFVSWIHAMGRKAVGTFKRICQTYEASDLWGVGLMKCWTYELTPFYHTPLSATTS